MNKFQIALISAALAAVITIPFAIRKESRLRMANAELRQQVEQRSLELGESAESVEGHRRGLESESEPLAESEASARGAESLELLRLRGEVSRARRELAELQTPEGVYSVYADATAKAYQEAVAAGIVLSEEDRKNGFPRDSWVFAGFATPKAAMQSLMWAMNQGDPQTLLQCLGPDGLQWIREATFHADGQSQLWHPPWREATIGEIAANAQQAMRRITGFGIPSYNDRADSYPLDRLTYLLVPEGAETKYPPLDIVIVKVGSEWKCAKAGFLFADTIQSSSR